MKNKKYYVYHSSYMGTEILTEEIRICMDLIGEFDSFAEAKRFAINAAKTTVSNFECDLSGARDELKKLRQLRKRDIE